MSKTPTNRLFYENDDGSFRQLSDAERTKAISKINAIDVARKKVAKAKKELDKVLKQHTAGCDHKIFYDEPGFLYDIRYCPFCGHTSLI